MSPRPVIRSPELLAPAGSLAMLRTALAFGADAIYGGQPRYSLRVRNNDFGALATLRRAIDEAHDAGRKFYLVSNVLPHNAKVRSYLTDMAPALALGPDALIMADPGLIDLARGKWPDVPIHLSVQANTVNFAAVRFWQKLGLARVILSRELSLDEIAEIRQECPDVELEVFVHGALCIAHSGRCLLSGYFNHREANQGACTNSCRWDYRLHRAEVDDSGDLRPVGASAGCVVDGQWLVEEGQRPGQLMPIEEDRHGTYLLNSKDLRAVEHVRRLTEIGVDSLKIEGRTKSAYYVARTTQVYRRAVDDAVAGRPFDAALLGELDGLANRGYTSGFYQRHQPQDTQNYQRGHSESGRSLYVGEVVGWDHGQSLALVEVKNRLALGDRIELIHPSGNRQLSIDRMLDLDGHETRVAPGSGHCVWIPLPAEFPGAMLARFL
ncbi:tRNA 5-hydroxyuridine modification protein YegQ [Accumulibacter sp.]|uniref:prephenate-dependent tRNA uridine(34) hydroxylase TrhP n=1 Tax=Accumulibacter sp. TaxID=2053492 RepID=UPI0025D99C3C|nr:tRNA 5-hydroxyuridine modification protein YegQ [Accumulibacter sp.]MCM8594068.1 tRNA 5-hydroxyuridine modification protein YegQ [Accumulibacter sp.]MCM8627678.1 tRNA 5-hydroxyuridine modification protein YegQ [Accumulibacter sp.]MDS4048212.1 tRNA 5-hydroxyuridine modification protein YegQ [Accumulibacter sp.]